MNRQEFAQKFEAGAKGVSDWIGAHKTASIAIGCFVAGLVAGLLL